MLRLLLRHSVMPLIKHVPAEQRCELRRDFACSALNLPSVQNPRCEVEYSETQHDTDRQAYIAVSDPQQRSCQVPKPCKIFFAPHCRQQWLLPVLARLLPHMQQRLTSSWQRQMSPDNGTSLNGTTGRSAAEADVVQVFMLPPELQR